MSNLTRELHIKLTPKAAKNMIKEEGGLLRVYVTAVPEDGKANKAMIKLLSEHFKISKSSFTIIKGLTSREKVVLINFA